jgi:hypothetical protein
MRLSVSKALLGLTLTGLLPVAHTADRKAAPSHPTPATEPAPRNPQPKNPSQRPLNANNPSTVLDRWNAMTPAQREKALANLPPERQKAIRERVQRFNQQFNQLPKAEQQMLRAKMERFNRLSPREQQTIRRDIRAFNQLPPDRRQALHKELDKVHKMPDDQRDSYLASDELRNRYSPDEQQMLRSLAKILPAPPK